MKINNVMLRVYNIEVSLDFYQKVLGLNLIKEIEFKEAKMYFLAEKEGDPQLALTYNYFHPEKYSHGSHFGYIGYEVKSIKDFASKLASLNMSFYREPFQDDSGNTIAFVKDPDGHVIELIEITK